MIFSGQNGDSRLIFSLGVWASVSVSSQLVRYVVNYLPCLGMLGVRILHSVHCDGEPKP